MVYYTKIGTTYAPRARPNLHAMQQGFPQSFVPRRPERALPTALAPGSTAEDVHEWMREARATADALRDRLRSITSSARRHASEASYAAYRSHFRQDKAMGLRGDGSHEPDPEADAARQAQAAETAELPAPTTTTAGVQPTNDDDVADAAGALGEEEDDDEPGEDQAEGGSHPCGLQDGARPRAQQAPASAGTPAHNEDGSGSKGADAAGALGQEEEDDEPGEGQAEGGSDPRGLQDGARQRAQRAPSSAGTPAGVARSGKRAVDQRADTQHTDNSAHPAKKGKPAAAAGARVLGGECDGILSEALEMILQELDLDSGDGDGPAGSERQPTYDELRRLRVAAYAAASTPEEVVAEPRLQIEADATLAVIQRLAWLEQSAPTGKQSSAAAPKEVPPSTLYRRAAELLDVFDAAACSTASSYMAPLLELLPTITILNLTTTSEAGAQVPDGSTSPALYVLRHRGGVEPEDEDTAATRVPALQLQRMVSSACACIVWHACASPTSA